MSDVFISHIEKDRNLALEIARGLEAAGYTTWSYGRDSPGEFSYLFQVDVAIAESQAVVVVISADSLGSEQVENEVRRARQCGKPFIYVLKGMSLAEFPNRQRVWEMASRVRVLPEGPSAILPSVIRSLQELAVRPTRAQEIERGSSHFPGGGGGRGEEPQEIERAAAERAARERALGQGSWRERDQAEAERWARERSTIDPELDWLQGEEASEPTCVVPLPAAVPGAERSTGPVMARSEGRLTLTSACETVLRLPPQPMGTRIATKLHTMKRRLAIRFHRLRSRQVPAADLVDCTVFAPPTVSLRDTFLVQVFSHRPEQAEATKKLATEFDRSAERRGFKSLESDVQRGSTLRFHLTMRGFHIDDDVQQITWRGSSQSVQFGVTVPRNIAAGNAVGTVTVDQDSVPLGHIKFKIAVTGVTQRTVPSEPVGEAAHRYKKAFVSYASPDRNEVLKRVQMLSTLRIAFFQDVLNLEPGERWRKALYRHIDESDLFLLFWSTAAKESEWVVKEVRYALTRKGDDELAPPEILPVLIEGPPPVEPPEELKDLHFDDRLLYFMTPPSRWQ